MALERTKKIGVLGVPLGYAAGMTGSELGVSAMRLSRVHGQTLVERIRELGYDVVDHGDAHIVQPATDGDEEGPKHITEMLASSENILRDVGAALSEGEFPVILGGDHSIAISTFSAVAKHNRDAGNGEIGLIWFDAHGDINTPQTSPSGNIHGMPLAVLLGHGDERLVNLGGFAPKLSHKYLAHVGARDEIGR